ncbi:MAG: hypothetical protein LBQ52_04565 [Helicobacteraceae bacterium]|jgi:hypothetical protein|nr:hypothetical protein [Helicobacteraceae bacterium]
MKKDEIKIALEKEIASVNYALKIICDLKNAGAAETLSGVYNKEGIYFLLTRVETSLIPARAALEKLAYLAKERSDDER